MSEPTSFGNPYDAPHDVGELEERQWSYPLGKLYWRLMFATFVVNALLVLDPMYRLPAIKNRPFPASVLQTPAIGLGLFGGIVSTYALIYGLVYANRVVRRRHLRRYEEVRDQQFAFYARSLGFGLLLTISTLTAFVCCCVPTSMPFLSYSAGGGMSGDSSPATIFAVFVALAVSGFIILKILPREDLC